MVNWEEFEHLHVIKRLRQILGSWWNLDVILTDEFGELKNWNHVRVHYVNPMWPHLLPKEVVREKLKEFAVRNIDDLRMVDASFTIKRWEVLEIDAGIFPIIIDRDFLGSVMVLGFFSEGDFDQRMTLFQDRLAAFGASRELIEQASLKIRYISGVEREHLIGLGSLLADEIVTLYIEVEKREDRIKELSHEVGGRYRYDNMIGKSKPMQALYGLLDKIKNADSTILIQGENGTGKELIAKSIHYNSPRREKPFVIQNCSAFNDNLLESELFGHVKGSFTGAIKDKKGLFEIADKGTFFLDEIGDTSPQMQVKLLRVLQEGTFTPVGSTEVKKVDVRIIAATNRNLREMVEKGQFREDLYYRLNVINIRVPPLRERKEDIPLLVEYFLAKVCEAQGVARKVLTRRALELFYDYPWPGNVRELQNEIERLVVLSGAETKIVPEMLSPKILEYQNQQGKTFAKKSGTLKEIIEEVEKDLIREGLRRTGWNKSKLAKELGISRANLIAKVEKYGLDKRRLLKSG